MTTVNDEPLCFGQYINGQTIDPICQGGTLDKGAVPVVSPATNRPALHFVPSTDNDVDRAVQAAHDAFHARDTDATAWSHPSQMSRRSAVLNSIAALLRQNTERLADLE